MKNNSDENGALTLLFDRDRGLYMELEDNSSGHTIRVELKTENVSAVLSRQSTIPCKVTWGDLSRIGLVRETKRVEIVPTWKEKYGYRKPPSEVVEDACKEQGFLVDGWVLWSDGTRTQQRGENHTVILRRYIEEPT